jgi:biotin transport system substrate-specific component
VLLLGLSFGYKIGLSTVGLYLLEGIVGLPVFSNSPERGVGIVYFIGPTMGYLIGFLSACYLASFIKLNDNFFKILIKLILAVSTIYIFGILWLGTLIGWDKPIFSLGVAPFLFAETFKILLLSLLVKKLIKLKNFI